jgi:hypothetical protein
MTFNLQRYLFAQEQSLYQRLLSLRPQMAQAAQEIYDQWQANDPEVGGGGICDEIARSLSDIIVSNLEGVEVTEGGQDGDDHAYIIVYNNSECFGVDIPYQVYERGGGYSWTKIEGVKFSPDHVVIFPLNRQDYDFN